jgi:predicted esterase
MIHEHHLPVTRTARYFTLGGEAAVTDVWIACHGYGQLGAEFAGEFEVVADPHRLVVVPEGLSRFYLDPIEQRMGTPGRVGATWMTREDRLAEIDDHVRYLDALSENVLSGLPREAVRVRALGFSQGVATVCRWLALGNTRVDELIVWGGRVPEDIESSALATRLRSTAVTVVLGTRDRYATPEVAELVADRFRKHDVTADVILFSGGHRMDREVLRTIAARPPALSPSL